MTQQPTIPKKIILCADDFGQNCEISTGIVNLLKQKRLSAVSCMTSTQTWQESAKHLLPFKEHVDIGLHFNLTHGIENRHDNISKLLFDIITRKIKQSTVITNLEEQLENFIQSIGKIPDFIDGHQHIHQFPIISSAFIKTYNTLFKTTKPYIRLVQIQKPNNIKAFILNFLAKNILSPKLKQHHIPYNNSFSGVYYFRERASYENYFNTFLDDINHKGLVMCHPGLASQDTNDPIRKTRLIEYDYLMSEKFLTCLNEKKIILSRFAR